ncbi:hypothetical protein [Yeosuana sp.]|uniref:hypothetical protein n=1 Tax=Yeosuana sp. TaxID=2529388 RepID=UPI004055300D
MKTKFYLMTLLCLFTLFSCKQNNTFTDFKYADQPVVLNCENLNSKLYQEALYSFENDIANFYSKDKNSLSRSYSQFIRASAFNQVKFTEIVSPHTLQVFEALKKDSDLWNSNNSTDHFNYKSSLMNCIAKNIGDKDLKTTLNALLSTNSMSSKLFNAPLISNYGSVINDKYLATYVAFDLFYARLFDVDFTQIKAEKPQAKVDFNVTQ